MAKIKESLLEIARQLPDECTWDEVMYQIYVRQKIEAGLKDLDEGRAVDHDVLFEDFAKSPSVVTESSIALKMA